MGQWIDFKTLRQSIDFRKVLEFYDIQLKPRGPDQFQAYCPLPNHPGEKSSRSMSVNLPRGIWHCHGCKQGGNMIDLVARLEGLDPEAAEDIRKAGLLLSERFLPPQKPRPTSGTPKKERQTSRPAAEPTSKKPQRKPNGEERLDMPRVANAPLDFALKNLDPHHAYFKDRGLRPETIAHFGLGHCSRGMLAGSIAIPLHDANGSLVGYAGLLVDGKATDPARLLFPTDRVREGVMHIFRKSILLYNSHALDPSPDDLVVTQDFESAWALWQTGIKKVVSLMGSECSPEQASMIVQSVSAKGRVWVLAGGDQAMARCAAVVLGHVAPHRFMRLVMLEAGQQPVELPATRLRQLFEGL